MEESYSIQDTACGIGCDATNPEAVAKIYQLKKRVETQSMIFLMNREKMMYNTFKEIPDLAWYIMNLSENLITLILDKPQNAAPNNKAKALPKIAKSPN
jgi:L-threonylcarbamoyladenylate synthase